MTRIAVIGGGAAGASVLGELLRQYTGNGLELTWFAGRRSTGRGIAYSTQSEHHLLNVRAAGMGLFADDVGAFFQYASSRHPHAKGSDFVPRAWFGDFIETTLGALVETARTRGHTLTTVQDEAIAVRGSDALGYVVTSRDGDDVHADAVVLAVGALPPSPLAEASHEARCSGAYALDPWQWPKANEAPRHVVVLGAALTAIDTILDIAERWPEARITAVSRRGRLPTTHLDTPGEPYAHPQDLVDAMLARPDLRHWLRLLRETSAEPGLDWRALMDGLRPSTPRLWQALSEHERARFLRHLRPLWDLHRHRLPPRTTRAIEALRVSGRLEVVAARIAGIDGAGPLEVRLRRPRGAGELRLEADLVIQATGLNTSVGDTQHRLVRQILDEGIARADALGLGLAADASGLLLRPDGSTSTHLRIVGTLLRGALWECTGLAEIRAGARALARDLVERLPATPRAAAAKPPRTRPGLLSLSP